MNGGGEGRTGGAGEAACDGDDGDAWMRAGEMG